ncbi:hypothetical protein IQ07DRAFT_595519 [Pyrenochaeta sp. DS3sAY3a]|nr:hypothetical protein IQ07DRAFT_595519 [Pyrenochaeta sp. DS3sAY3a]
MLLDIRERTTTSCDDENDDDDDDDDDNDDHKSSKPTPPPPSIQTPMATTPSPLLSLPPELRLQIATHVLSPHTFPLHCWRVYNPSTFRVRILKKRTHYLALTRVCRLLHAETRLLPLQLNTFVFKHQSAFDAFLDGLSVEQMGAVRRVVLVSWMARRMVEGEGWRLKGLEECFPVLRFGGLRCVTVQVRMNGWVGGLHGEDCLGGEKGVGLLEEEEKFRKWVLEKTRGVEVVFERVSV